MFTLIAAHALNGVIGDRGRIPWHLPSDLAFFRRTTLGHVVIMGRKTFESMGRPLPDRRNVLLTRNQKRLGEGVEVFHSLEQVVEQIPASLEEGQQAFVIGGAQIYERFLEQAESIYVTIVDAVVPGDAYFPRIQGAWRVELLEEHTAKPTRPLKDAWYPHRIYKISRSSSGRQCPNSEMPHQPPGAPRRS